MHRTDAAIVQWRPPLETYPDVVVAHNEFIRPSCSDACECNAVLHVIVHYPPLTWRSTNGFVEEADIEVPLSKEIGGRGGI